MVVTINGKRRELPAGATVANAVELMRADREGRGVAVAVGGEVVPRAEWALTELAEGVQIEVVVAVQGG